MTHRTYSPTLAPIPCSEHDGVSTATQDAGALFISPRPARLGGGVYIGTRKATTTPGHFARQYVALDRGAASRLLADLATALAEVEEVKAEPWTPRRGDYVTAPRFNRLWDETETVTGVVEDVGDDLLGLRDKRTGRYVEAKKIGAVLA